VKAKSFKGLEAKFMAAMKAFKQAWRPDAKKKA
jgi:hypothetical protein